VNEILEGMSNIIRNNYWIAPFIAFLAGVLTSITPCSLSSIPLVIGYVGGSKIEGSKNALKLSIVFAVGMGITYTILGAISALIGKLMQGGGNFWYIVLRSSHDINGFANF
jgi:cytochrome c-type biogenesis protein